MKGAWGMAIVAFAALLATAAVAKPERAAVLLNFSRPVPTSNTEEASLSSPELDTISMAMVRQFAGEPLETTASELPRWSQPHPLVAGAPLSPASLGNPFVIYSLSRQPYASALARMPVAPIQCAALAYRPSLGFGRFAEERRRVIYPLVQQAACEHGLPVGLLDALIMQESRYQPTALSPKGAVGLAQLMPGTARNLGVDAYILADNLRGGARYLKQQYDRFGRYDLALAAYNAGPGRVQRGWAVPRIAETRGYVRTIIANWTSVSPITVATASSMPFRQAQLIFMPARAVAR